MTRATTAVGRFYNEPELRGKVRKALQQAITANGEGKFFIPDAKQTFQNITRIPDIGPGIATRLITLARPDRSISLNNASVRGLTKWLTGRAEPVLPVDEGSYTPTH